MKAKIISLLLLILITLTAVSCRQEVIFADIAREVKLDDPAIVGNIYSLVPLGGKLYVQNGNIFKKENVNTAHGWVQIAVPENSGNIIRLASDDTYLYAMDASLNEEGYLVHAVWATNPAADGGWTKIAEDVAELFDNQVADSSCNTTGRTAYITVTSEIQGDTENVSQQVKMLSGSATPATVSVPEISATVPAGEYIKAAVYDGSTTVFSNIAAICASGTTLYSVNSRDSDNAKVVKYKTSGGSWQNGGSVSDIPMCICAFGTDKLLVGTANGYEICTIDSSTKKPSDGANSTTNAESLIGNKRRIITIKAVGSSSVYAGVISDNSSEYSKLWGWFGDSWNYE
ncbi:MAG: hypothetical protein KBT02_00620 [Treponema sp.]|nr:hypothetical protein [Candidatus Treponema caballi]